MMLPSQTIASPARLAAAQNHSSSDTNPLAVIVDRNHGAGIACSASRVTSTQPRRQRRTAKRSAGIACGQVESFSGITFAQSRSSSHCGYAAVTTGSFTSSSRARASSGGRTSPSSIRA